VAVLWSDLIGLLLEPILPAQGSQDDATAGDTDINLGPLGQACFQAERLGDPDSQTITPLGDTCSHRMKPCCIYIEDTDNN